MMTRVSILVAMTPDGVIGRAGTLPWHLPADLARFKRLTMGHHVIMGRRTFESLPGSLPGRTIIVLSRQAASDTSDHRVAASLDVALGIAAADDEVFVAGGAEVYRAGLERAVRIYQTVVHASVAGDTWFPTIVDADWQVVQCVEREPDARNVYPMTMRTLDRIDSHRAHAPGGT